MTKIETCVVLAAGRGQRISGLPMTRILPKCMLPILDRPILHYVLDNAKRFGARDIRLVVGESRSVIEKYFGTGSEFGLDISYLSQSKPRGIAHAISLLENHITDHFLVILGDDLTFSPSLLKMEDVFHTERAAAVEAIVREENSEILHRTCSVEMTDSGQITDLTEKPQTLSSCLRGCGMYIFDPVVFDYIHRTPASHIRDELEITDTLRLMAHDGLVFGFRITGQNVNVNTTQDLFYAISLAMKSKMETLQIA